VSNDTAFILTYPPTLPPSAEEACFGSSGSIDIVNRLFSPSLPS
jgi:hypothetical protein